MFRLALLCLAATLAAAPAFAADPPKCKLAKVAEWPVRFQGNVPIIDGEINGKKVAILLDTGATFTNLNTATAEKLDLPLQLTGQRALGFGGESRIYVTAIDELRIGDAVRKGMRVRVTGERAASAFDMILGDDFFKQTELEFDYANSVVRLFQAFDCKNARLAYWDANALELPLEDDRQIVVPVVINGRKERALIDSGAFASVVATRFAATVGITPQSPDVVDGGCSGGVGGAPVRNWIATFDSVAIAGENIRDAKLRIADFMSEVAYTSRERPEVVFGTDFLRAHRVLVSRTQGKMYFSYAGGVVFSAPRARPCPPGS